MTAGSMLWHWTGAGAEAITGAGKTPLTLAGATPSAPARFGTATRIEEATSNLIANPSAEVDTSGWTAAAGAETVARITTRAQFGSASIEVQTPGTSADEGVYQGFNAAASTQYAASAYVRGDGGGTVKIALYDNIGGSFARSAAVTLTAEWQRITVAGTTSAGASTFRAYVRTDESAGAQAITFDVDGLQVEVRADVTSYCDGSLGAGYAWSGVAHASSSMRDASRVESEIPFDAAKGAVAVWLRPLWASGAGQQRTVLHRRADANNELHLQHTAAGNWRVEWVSGGSTEFAELAAAHAAGEDVLLVCNWSASTLGVSVNGGTLTETARAAGAPDLFTAVASAIGRQQHAAAGYLDAVVGPVLVFDRRAHAGRGAAARGACAGAGVAAAVGDDEPAADARARAPRPARRGRERAALVRRRAGPPHRACAGGAVAVRAVGGLGHRADAGGQPRASIFRR